MPGTLCADLFLEYVPEARLRHRHHASPEADRQATRRAHGPKPSAATASPATGFSPSTTPACAHEGGAPLANAGAESGRRRSGDPARRPPGAAADVAYQPQGVKVRAQETSGSPGLLALGTSGACDGGKGARRRVARDRCAASQLRSGEPFPIAQRITSMNQLTWEREKDLTSQPELQLRDGARFFGLMARILG